MGDYPHNPGHRSGDTDMAAAEAVAGAAVHYERLSYEQVARRPSTADEVHAEIERQLGRAVPLYTIRPRLSALRAKGMVVDTGERRLSSAGRCKQRVYRVATPEERAVATARQEAAR